MEALDGSGCKNAATSKCRRKTTENDNIGLPVPKKGRKDMEVVTCRAPVNIAVIKYWGKRDEELILPINDSISCTLSMDHMYAKTTIMASPKFKENKFWLNGEEQSFDNKRLANCIKDIQEVANGNLKWNLHICSENNFPTAAGLASSAAGYACLVTALANIYKVKGDLSAIARRGSGSACRSVYGGWVQWHMGVKQDGSDSIASEIAPCEHWPEMRILVLVVNDSKKKYSSTSGMSQSVATSQLLKYRASMVVPDRVKRMLAAIKARNFHDFAELTMADSNQFHAVCLDTYPPCVYMNDISHAIAEMVHGYNEYKNSNKIAYTFDAGPNACLYLLEQDVPEVIALINEHFPNNLFCKDKYIRGLSVTRCNLNEELKSLMKISPIHNSLKYIIHTKPGVGPTISYESSDHLLDESGLPKVK